jgi:acyl-CoA synthetase (AMP-forming)/AMP-acid ligase II
VDTDREQLVIVQEVRASAGQVDPAAVVSKIQREIGREFAVPVANVLLVRPGTVRRTTSGKIQRTLMRKLFLGNQITALHEVVDRDVAAMIRPVALEPVA